MIDEADDEPDTAATEPKGPAADEASPIPPLISVGLQVPAYVAQMSQATAAYQRWVEGWYPNVLEASRALQERAEQFHEASLRVAQHASQVAEAVTEFAARLPDAATLLQRLRQFYPVNWPSDMDVDAAAQIMRDEGVPLAWVPRPSTVAKLVAAADLGARDALLVDRVRHIVEDCRTAMGEVRAVRLSSLAELALDAILALERGVPSAAQALATNVLDTLIRDAARRGQIFGTPVGFFEYKKITKRITPVSDETLLAEYRTSCVFSPLLQALADYPGAGPIPTRFGRHPTAHLAHPTQYTPANAIIAVMLMTSMLREAQESGW